MDDDGPTYFIKAPARLAAAKLAVELATHQLQAEVLAARRNYVPWSDIASAIGMTRQSAWSRWHHLDEDSADADGDARRG